MFLDCYYQNVNKGFNEVFYFGFKLCLLSIKKIYRLVLYPLKFYFFLGNEIVDRQDRWQ